VQVIPAIDILDGKCVRLRQGDYQQETVYSADPAETARRWIDQGATCLHVVDLSGARTGRVVHHQALHGIVEVANAAGVLTQFGGGLREQMDVLEVLQMGIGRLVIGTKALQAPQWLYGLAAKYPNKVWLGLDARDGRVSTQGWLETSECRAIDFAKEFEDEALAGIIYTDISRDGMLTGPNFGAIKELAAAVSLPIIASGGIGTLGDIRLLNRLPVAGCIVGRALYEGKFTLKEAIETVSGRL
jgi:phosphoribosylformimino-5-aminoimidazole carboxamide ribotide isomerase